ncbi:hypothetical protein PHJA_002969300 [Phtheirospermum japonicum]|uniref:Uncharacterized protein n=1 Tax=Phtheirospermum japonicum TaxID=374723 RepID=A0A830DC17_9LAMI|nr:hypothetical protein PHJA_002969300 [Phtheirospermum japonicum]
MRKQISYIEYNWVEVVPSPLRYPHKASNAPKLETIAEEGSEKIDFASMMRAIYILPIVLSIGSYLLVNRLSVV